MPTRLGDVSIKLKLDVSDAERRLSELESRATSPARGGGDRGLRGWRSIDEGSASPWKSIDEGPSAQRGPYASWRRPPSPRQMTKRQVEAFFDRLDKERIRKTKADHARALASVVRHRTGGGTSLSRPAGISDIPGVQSARTALGLAGMESVGVKSTLGLAGLIYAGISESAKAAPIMMSAIRGALDIKPGTNPAFDAAEKTTEKLRDVVVDFEAKVKGYFKGYSDSLDMAGAVARVTGQVPTLAVPGLTATSSYYAIFAEKARQESVLDSKFEEFQRKDVGEAVGKYFAEAFKSSMRQ